MNTKKLVILILIIMLFNFMFLSKTFAISDMIDDGNGFLDASEGEETVINTEELKKTSSDIYNILLMIGIAVAVIVGAILGTQLIFGSVEGKAKVAETLIPYIIGCVVVFGAFTIWKFAVDSGNSITDDSTPVSTPSTPPSSVECAYCGTVNEVPFKIFTGGYDWSCTNCKLKMIKDGVPLTSKQMTGEQLRKKMEEERQWWSRLNSNQLSSNKLKQLSF